MAGIATVFLALCRSGDRIVAARQLYGNTYSILARRLPNYGITTSFADVGDLDAIRASAPGAKLIYCETIGNPIVEVADLPALAEIAQAAGIPLVVDNTFASPILCRPLEHGASIVLHSATKYIGGHHDLMGGVVCSSPDLLEPIRALARDLGPTLSPFAAWLCLRGLATIHLRTERASETALAVARFLATRPDIESVNYPGLESDRGFALAAKLMDGRGGGVLGFSVGGGRDRAGRFQESLQLIAPAASLGGTHSLIVHAPSITHTQLSDDELRAAGISEGFCRLAIGLEDADDLIADLEQALDRTA